MKEILSTKKVIICVGTGGVGKTTISSALGVLAAKQGKKVLILTIDPAKRLAQALGIEKNNEVCRVPIENVSGELYAGMLLAEETFKRYIYNAAPSKEAAENIMTNNLYKQLSSKLSGSQEFTSMLDLLEYYNSNEYDLIILDTPPSQHAVDFLNAPIKIRNLFQNQITEWFSNSSKKDGFLTRVFQKSTQMVLGVFEKVTGDVFMKELSHFFNAINSLQKSIHENSVDSHNLLHSDKTAFVLVSSNERAKMNEANKLLKRLNNDGYGLDALVVNQSHPQWVEGLSLENGNSGSFTNEQKDLISNVIGYYKERKENYKLFSESVEVLTIPQFSKDLSGTEGLVFLSEYLNK